MVLSRPVFRSRPLWLITAAIAVVVVISLFLITPSQSQQLQGSTYGRSPGDYGAWWTWMADNNTPVQRWQKAPEQLERLPTPSTLLRIAPQAIVSGAPQTRLNALSAKDYQWVAQGNRLVYLGRWGNLSPAPFSQTMDSEFGPVVIQGRRRATTVPPPLLADDYGAIIWREAQGKGDIIWVIPPFLAANAFQDQAANFQLLQALMQPDRHQLWVDEYFHGYKDSETLAAEAVGTVWGYLQQTPLFPLFVQLLLLSGLLIGWGNRRFGRPSSTNPRPQNSRQTYVLALAQILEKGDRPEFVVQQLLQAEACHRGELPNLVSLAAKPTAAVGDHSLLTPINPAALIQPRHSPDIPLPGPSPNPQKLPRNEKELQVWLKQWQQRQAQFPRAIEYDGSQRRKP